MLTEKGMGHQYAMQMCKFKVPLSVITEDVKTKTKWLIINYKDV